MSTRRLASWIGPLSLGLVLACTGGGKGQPSSSTEASPEAKTEATIEATIDAKTEAKTEARSGGGTGETGGGEDTGGGETGGSGETGEPPPEFAAVPPGDDPLRALLGGDMPETVEVIATHEHGRRTLVLYRVDVGTRWRASRPDDDPVLEAVDAAMQVCEDEASMYSYNPCLEEAATGVEGVPAGMGPHLAFDGYAWEIAEIEFDRAGQARILAKKQLLDFGISSGGEPDESDFEGVETKLKVYDMDGDKRGEIMVVFMASLPSEDSLDATDGALGFVLDRSDLHVQFATTRLYHYEWSDVDTIVEHIETTWQTRDENGDGYTDLVVREATRNDRYSGEGDEPDEHDRSRRETICLYELAGDRWVCPEWLGDKLVDGGQAVEVTTVPLPVPEQAPSVAPSQAGAPASTAEPAPAKPEAAPAAK